MKGPLHIPFPGLPSPAPHPRVQKDTVNGVEVLGERLSRPGIQAKRQGALWRVPCRLTLQPGIFLRPPVPVTGTPGGFRGPSGLSPVVLRKTTENPSHSLREMPVGSQKLPPRQGSRLLTTNRHIPEGMRPEDHASSVDGCTRRRLSTAVKALRFPLPLCVPWAPRGPLRLLRSENKS